MEYSVINRIDAKQPCDYHILGIFNDKKTNLIKSSVDKDIGENIIDSIKNAELMDRGCRPAIASGDEDSAVRCGGMHNIYSKMCTIEMRIITGA